MQSNLHRSSSDISHNAKIYEYPDGSIDIMAASAAIFREPGWEAEKPTSQGTPRAAGVIAEGDAAMRSAWRARGKMRRLAMSNHFDYFVTLTLDQTKIDRYDPVDIQRKLNIWCDNMVRRHNMLYILVPELHKDGAFHFHGFIAGDIQVVDSGHKSAGQTVYNLPQWKLGFSTAIPLYGEYARAVAYCCKYIGKQQGKRVLGRWYFSGGKLAQPVPELKDIDLEDFLTQFPDSAQIFTPLGTIYCARTRKKEETHENGICEAGKDGNRS